MAVRIRHRRGLAATAATNNIVLSLAERGFETDTKRWKTGDGVTPWNDLLYDDEIGSAANYIAGAAIGGHRVIMIETSKAVHFDPSEENNTGKTLGVSKNAAVTDDPVTVVHQGIIKSSGWGLTPDAIYYAGSNGTITVTIPTSGILQRIGIAVDSDTLMVKFSEPIVLI